MAYLPTHVLHIASGRGSGSESNAGTAATLHDSCDLGYLHTGGDSRQAYSPHRGSIADCWKWRIEASTARRGAISHSIPKMPSGANAFEISDIQEERNREPVLAKRPEFSNVTCYIASRTCRGINSPGTGWQNNNSPATGSGFPERANIQYATAG